VHRKVNYIQILVVDVIGHEAAGWYSTSTSSLRHYSDGSCYPPNLYVKVLLWRFFKMNSMRFVTLACFKSYSIHMEVSWQNQNRFQTCGRVERRGCKRGKKAGKRTEGLDVWLGGDFLYLKGRKLCVISVWQGIVNPRKTAFTVIFDPTSAPINTVAILLLEIQLNARKVVIVIGGWVYEPNHSLFEQFSYVPTRLHSQSHSQRTLSC